jgi:hypothetical protein
MAKRKPRQSPLEHFPEYTKALGLIAVELANLEVVLSNLLGAILNASQNVSSALYFTPKSSQARMETLQNLVEEVLPNTPFLSQAKSLLRRSLRLVNKRNDMLHGTWGISRQDPVQVFVLSLPSGKKDPVEVETLTTMVNDLRILADEVTGLNVALGLQTRTHYKINLTYQFGPKSDN